MKRCPEQCLDQADRFQRWQGAQAQLRIKVAVDFLNSSRSMAILHVRFGTKGKNIHSVWGAHGKTIELSFRIM